MRDGRYLATREPNRLAALPYLIAKLVQRAGLQSDLRDLHRTGLVARMKDANLKKDTLELPAGLVAADEPTAQAAQREPVEETGYVVADGGTLHTLGGYTLWLAAGSTGSKPLARFYSPRGNWQGSISILVERSDRPRD